MEEKIKRKIEADLNRYRRFKARLKEIKNRLKDVTIETSSMNENKVQESNTKLDIVTKSAVEHEKLWKEANFIENKVRQIENGLEALTEEQRTIIINRYINGVHRKNTLVQLNIEKSNYYTILHDGLRAYAEVTGLLPILINGENS